MRETLEGSGVYVMHQSKGRTTSPTPGIHGACMGHRWGFFSKCCPHYMGHLSTFFAQISENYFISGIFQLIIHMGPFSWGKHGGLEAKISPYIRGIIFSEPKN